MQRNFKKLAKFAVLCGLAVGIMVHPAFATDAPVRTTEKVIVTAGRIAEKAKTVTQNVTVIDEEMIQKNQHKSLDKILAQQGIQITGNGADTSMPMQISLRGQMSTSDDPNQGHVMVLINGQRTVLTSLNMIPMVSIERVEVLRGPAAVQYGSMAFGGVVNIITKKGSDQTQASIEIGGGSWESWKGMAGASGMVGDVDFAFGFSHSLRNGNWKDGDGNKIDNTQIGGQTTYYANAGYNFAEEHRFGVTFMGANFDRLGDWGGSYAFKNGNDKTTYDDRKNYALGISYEGGIKEYGLSWLAKYNHSDDYNAYCPDPADNAPYRMDSKNDNVVAQLSWKYNFLTLTGGMEYNNTESEKKSPYYGTPKYKLSNVSSFLMVKTAFFDEKLIFSAGARYDDYKMKVEEEKTEDNVSLNAGVVYSPWDWLTFRANIGEAFRMPTGLEVLGYKDSMTTYTSDPNLGPEEGLGWDIGFESQYKGFKGGLTYFVMDWKDRIVGIGDYYNVCYQNASNKVKIRGIEGNISYDIGEAFGWDFILRPYVSFTHIIDQEGPDYRGVQKDYIDKVRDLVATFGINYSHPTIGLDVDFSVNYLGKQDEPVFYYDAEGNIEKSVVEKTGDNYIVDLAIMKRLYETDDMGKISAKLDLRNIFDEQYSYSAGYPMPGRSFFLSLIWNY